MSFGYLAATETPADRATIWTFLPASRTELLTGVLAALYAHARWRNPLYTGMVGFAGTKIPILTGVILALDAMKATKRRFAEG